MKFSITLPKTQQPTDIRNLLEQDWLIPRKVRHFLRTRKNVLCNGQPILFHEKVQAGDLITLIFEESDYPLPTLQFGNKANCHILFEDEHLIILNKKVGVKTHPNQPDETNTLFNDVAAYLKEKNQIPYVVHRLDKETSGAILFAKNSVILPILGRILEQKGIQRLYEAEVAGHFASTEPFTIDKKIGRHRQDRRKRVVDEQQGQKAVTHVTPFKEAAKTTWVTCQLETGRTHQIRVHLEAIGHPIIGDPLYEKKLTRKVSRLQLHAKELSLVHPFTKETICVEAQPLLSNQNDDFSGK